MTDDYYVEITNVVSKWFVSGHMEGVVDYMGGIK